MGVERMVCKPKIKCKLPEKFSEETIIKEAICSSLSANISESKGKIILELKPNAYTLPFYEKWVLDDSSTVGTQPLRLLITFDVEDGRRSIIFIGEPTKIEYDSNHMPLTCEGTIKSGTMVDSIARAVEDSPSIPWYNASYLEKCKI